MLAEQKAAQTILEQGLKVRVTAPLILRLFGKRTIGLVVKQPSLGTLCRISDLYLQSGITADQLEQLDTEQAHALFAKHSRVLTLVAAYAVLNGKYRGRLLAKAFAKWLYWNISPFRLCSLVFVLVELSGTEAFTNSIRLVSQMRMTQPNLSQSQGS